MLYIYVYRDVNALYQYKEIMNPENRLPSANCSDG